MCTSHTTSYASAKDHRASASRGIPSAASRWDTTIHMRQAGPRRAVEPVVHGDTCSDSVTNVRHAGTAMHSSESHWASPRAPGTSEGAHRARAVRFGGAPNKLLHTSGSAALEYSPAPPTSTQQKECHVIHLHNGLWRQHMRLCEKYTLVNMYTRIALHSEHTQKAC